MLLAIRLCLFFAMFIDMRSEVGSGSLGKCACLHVSNVSHVVHDLCDGSNLAMSADHGFTLSVEVVWLCLFCCEGGEQRSLQTSFGGVHVLPAQG